MSAFPFSHVLLQMWVILACSLVFPQEGVCQRWVTQEKMGKLEIFGEVQLNAGVIQQQLDSVRTELKSRLQIDGSDATVQVVVFSSRNSYLPRLQGSSHPPLHWCSHRLPSVDSIRWSNDARDTHIPSRIHHTRHADAPL